MERYKKDRRHTLEREDTRSERIKIIVKVYVERFSKKTEKKKNENDYFNNDDYRIKII